MLAPTARHQCLACLLTTALLFAYCPVVNGQPSQKANVFDRQNLVAWCIVPFDSQKRTPAERARMLQELGITKLAYDYRAEHVPTFDEEVDQLQRHGIELTAWWFPPVMNAEAELILDVLRRHQVRTQLWVTGGGAATKSEEEQQRRVREEAERIRPIAEAAARIGCRVGLYNHGGWFGEPENQLAIIDELQLPNVGIVYNLHHGHEHLERFRELLERMRPHLYALNLNGMIPGGDQQGQKILPLGAGTLDAKLLQTIRDSGYTGPIGILNHTDHDARARLQDNLDGLDWLRLQMDGQDAGQRPSYRTWAPTRQPSPALGGGQVFPGKAEYRTPPLSALCRATLRSATNFNILIASDTKQSGDHWELFTQAGSGRIAVYLPGHQPDHVIGDVNVCDAQPHELAMLYEPERVRLYVDRRLVADQTITRGQRAGQPGDLAIGRLVEGRLTCDGQIASVKLYRGAVEMSRLDAADYVESLTEVGSWQFADSAATRPPPAAAAGRPHESALEFSAPYLAELVAAAEQGNAAQGAALFSSAKSACLSCHQIGEFGGRVGPALTRIGTERTMAQLAESVLWPNRQVEEKYQVVQILTADGEQLRGYLIREDDQQTVLRDPASGIETRIAQADIEARRPAPSLMPDGLINGWSLQQQSDLLAFLYDLGRYVQLRPELTASVLEHAQAHDPTPFTYNREPLDTSAWPSWEAHVNRDRLYDFYTKQANYFRAQDTEALLLMEYPGLDGGPLNDPTIGHWGNQQEENWAGNSWNEAQLGSLQCGVFHGPDQLTVSRSICLQLGDEQQLSVCFDPDTWTYPAVWTDGFIHFSTVRHGFIHGLLPQGRFLPPPDLPRPAAPFEYLGFYRVGPRVAFAFRMDGVEYLDAPWVEQGQFVRELAPRAEHSLGKLLEAAPPQWPEQLQTDVQLGQQQPYAIDTIELPLNNPWQAPIFCGGHAFLPDGSALVATMQGDVWQVTGLAASATSPAPHTVTWRRFAAGLHHALGVHIDQDGIFVLGRDQITRLHDLNHDGEADFYECFSNAYETSPAGHDYICGLERDQHGYFYIASGNQGLVRISPDGDIAEVVAEGFRNPDGLGLYPDGLATVPCSEGEWTPASMICGVPTAGHAGSSGASPSIPFYGYRGSRQVGRPIEQPELPMVYLPRGLDNSSGGQAYIDSDRWGPLQGNMLHFSFGSGSHFLLLRDEVEGQTQGAVVPLPGEFLSGVHRGRFSPVDGQLYVSGMTGWGNYATADGCFQRVRYTGGRVMLPTGFHVHRNGVMVEFSEQLDEAVASQSVAHFAQAWNYRYSGVYGSAEYSTKHFGVRGHDRLTIRSAHVLDDGRALFLEIPDLQPCNQLHLQIGMAPDQRVDMFLTCHRLDEPRLELPDLERNLAPVAEHPIHTDMLVATQKITNPWLKPIADARPLTIQAGKNLSFSTKTLRATAGETLALTFSNPDVVPHNWVLVEPGQLSVVGEQANQLVADPEAFVRQYVPLSSAIVSYTDIVEPGQAMTIYFRAPQQAGRYPYLCTFPGHWMVMNGELIVSP